MIKKFRCKIHNLSASYASKKFKCQCEDCRAWKRDAYLRTVDKERAKERSRLWRLENLERSRQNSRNYQKNNPEQLLKWQLKKYNLTLEEYYNFLDKQNNGCAICGSPARGMQHSKKDYVLTTIIRRKK